MHRNTFPPIASHLRRALIAAGLHCPWPPWQAARRRGACSDDWITRDTSLADLGISEPVVLSNSDAHQDFYLPVPRGVPIADATLNFDARYTRMNRAAPTWSCGPTACRWRRRTSPTATAPSCATCHWNSACAAPASCGWAWTGSRRSRCAAVKATAPPPTR